MTQVWENGWISGNPPKIRAIIQVSFSGMAAVIKNPKPFIDEQGQFYTFIPEKQTERHGQLYADFHESHTEARPVYTLYIWTSSINGVKVQLRKALKAETDAELRANLQEKMTEIENSVEPKRLTAAQAAAISGGADYASLRNILDRVPTPVVAVASPVESPAVAAAAAVERTSSASS